MRHEKDVTFVLPSKMEDGGQEQKLWWALEDGTSPQFTANKKTRILV